MVGKVVEKSFDQIETTTGPMTTTLAPTGPPSVPIFIIPSNLPVDDINTIIEDLPDEPAIVMVGPVIYGNNTPTNELPAITQVNFFDLNLLLNLLNLLNYQA